MLNSFQKAVLKVANNGRYAHIAEHGDGNAVQEAISSIDDDLTRFVLDELSDVNECDNKDEALNRIANLVADLEVMSRAVEHEA